MALGSVPQFLALFYFHFQDSLYFRQDARYEFLGFSYVRLEEYSILLQGEDLVEIDGDD